MMMLVELHAKQPNHLDEPSAAHAGVARLAQRGTGLRSWAFAACLGVTACGGGSAGAGTSPWGECSFEKGPASTSDEPRRTIPFDLVPAETAGEAGSSGCFSPGACGGEAVVTSSGGTFELTFADASRLVFRGAEPTIVGPPMASDGDTVWVEYTEEHPEVCPFCGTYEETSLVVRAAQDGDVLWIGQQGHRLNEVDETLVTELFGVAARSEAACTTDTFTAGCYTVTRQVFDHVLETEPEQVISHAQVTRVDTPNGAFDVVWASSEEDAVYNTGCNDGPGVARDRGFAARRVLEP